jgi:hypothetical protein
MVEKNIMEITEENNKYYMLVKNGNLKEMKQLIDKGLDINKIPNISSN